MGKFFIRVDSDDFINKHTIDFMSQILEKNNPLFTEIIIELMRMVIKKKMLVKKQKTFLLL